MTRLLRYGLAGAVAALLFSGGVILLRHAWPGLGPLGANTAAFFIVQPLAYLVHRRISFPDAGPASHRGLRFLAVNAAGLIVSSVNMALATRVLHVSYLWALACNWALVPACNFAIYAAFVFRVPARRPA